MLAGRCSILHENTFSTIRIEDHEITQHSVREVFDSRVILPSSLEMHRDNVDSMTSNILRIILYEYYAIVQDSESSINVTNHTLNAATCFLQEIYEATLIIRNTTTKL